MIIFFKIIFISMFYFQDEGIWFDEEDPTSDCYKPECCTNVYVDFAKGKFDYDNKYYLVNKYYINELI